MEPKKCVKNTFCRTCKYWQTTVRQNSTSGYCRLPHAGVMNSIVNPRFDRACSPGISGQELRKVRWPERLSQVQYSSVDTSGDIMTAPWYGCIHHKELLIDGLFAKIDGHKKVLLFGGTFDPPTIAHVEIPKQIARTIGATLVIYIPASQSPHKDYPPASDDTRLMLLEAALEEPVQNDPDFDATIWTHELWNPKRPSYTVNTFEYLTQQLKACTSINTSGLKLNFLMGGDQAIAFQAWKDYKRIEELVEPVVALRAPHTKDSILQMFPEDEREKWESRILDAPDYDISSTEVRRRVLAGEPLDGLVDEHVAALISIYCVEDEWKGESSGEN